jgi:hypothetical protein
VSATNAVIENDEFVWLPQGFSACVALFEKGELELVSDAGAVDISQLRDESKVIHTRARTHTHTPQLGEENKIVYVYTHNACTRKHESIHTGYLHSKYSYAHKHMQARIHA